MLNVPILGLYTQDTSCYIFFKTSYAFFHLQIRYSHGDFMRGTVLVFLPGLPEIKTMQDILVNNAHFRNLGLVWMMLAYIVYVHIFVIYPSPLSLSLSCWAVSMCYFFIRPYHPMSSLKYFSSQSLGKERSFWPPTLPRVPSLYQISNMVSPL